MTTEREKEKKGPCFSLDLRGGRDDAIGARTVRKKKKRKGRRRKEHTHDGGRRKGAMPNPAGRK